jgi:hypothetical protein
MKIFFWTRLFIGAIISYVLVFCFAFPIFVILAICSVIYSVIKKEDLSRMSMHIFNKWIHQFGIFCEKIFNFLLLQGELPTHSIADGMGFGGHRLT